MSFNNIKFYQGLESEYEQLGNNFKDHCFYYTYATAEYDESGKVVSTQGPYKLRLNDKEIFYTNMENIIAQKIIDNNLLKDEFSKYILKQGVQNQTIYSSLELIDSELKADKVISKDLVVQNNNGDKVNSLNIVNSTIDNLTVKSGSVSANINSSQATVQNLTVEKTIKLPTYTTANWTYDFENGKLNINEINANSIKVNNKDITEVKDARYDYIQIGNVYLSSYNGQLQITSQVPSVYTEID